MPIQVVAGALAIFAAIPVLFVTMTSPGSRGFLSKRASLLGGATDVREIVLTRSAADRMGRPAIEWTGRLMVRLSPQGWIDRTKRRMVLAGVTTELTVERFAVAKVMLGLLLFAAGWAFAVPNLRFGWLITILITAIGFFIPDALLNRKARDRQQRIEVELADVIDQVTMSMQAGLGFEAALARTARVGGGPLAAEVGRTVQQMSLGVSRADALRNLADRTDVADLKSFVLAVVQSEAYGLSISKVLNVQAEELRDKRRQRAEERALKIPVLLIFPLAVCIFPTLFIILLGPALIRIYSGIGIIAP
jgi:tight adherence protein C